MKEIKTKAVITCPKCGVKQEVEMPTNACQYFYECTNCNTMLKPKEKDCCVFCSYSELIVHQNKQNYLNKKFNIVH